MHQDVLAACALVGLHVPSNSDTMVLNDVKTHAGDLFDDLTIDGVAPRRYQIKWHRAGSRPLTAKDLRTDKIDFRIDAVLDSFLSAPARASEYRLVTTFECPDADLSALLVEEATVSPCSPGLPTRRFRLSADAVWPAGGAPLWSTLSDADRSAFVEFCDLFIIETGCPRSSLDLRAPGELEHHLISLLESQIGIGRPPNASRDLADAAAHLIHLAMSARADKQPRGPEHVTTALAVITDFGRVSEHLPIDPALLVPLPNAVRGLAEQSAAAGTVVVRGVPGAGKSWLLEALRQYLLAQGHLVATHYCFVDLLDPDRDRRSTIDVVFGSLIAELYDLDPGFVCPNVPRYAAGPRELEIILATALNARPELRITLIIDGLDHADRLSHPGRRLARDIAQELAELNLPDGVRLVVGSQAGDHLAPLLLDADTSDVPPWADEHIRALAVQAGVGGGGALSQHTADVTEIQDASVLGRARTGSHHGSRSRVACLRGSNRTLARGMAARQVQPARQYIRADRRGCRSRCELSGQNGSTITGACRGTVRRRGITPSGAWGSNTCFC